MLVSGWSDHLTYQYYSLKILQCFLTDTEIPSLGAFHSVWPPPAARVITLRKYHLASFPTPTKNCLARGAGPQLWEIRVSLLHLAEMQFILAADLAKDEWKGRWSKTFPSVSQFKTYSGPHKDYCCTTLCNRLLTWQLSTSKDSLSSLIIAEMDGTILSSLLRHLRGTCIEKYSLYTNH